MKLVPRLISKLLVLLIFAICSLVHAKNNIEFKVVFQPEKKTLSGKVQIQFESAYDQVEFFLHKNLKLNLSNDYNISIVKKWGYTNLYRLKTTTPKTNLELQFQGEINEPIIEGQSPGVISETGISLLSDSFWYPRFEFQSTWKIEVELPSGDWKAIMPGVKKQIGANRYEFSPFGETNEIVLIADRFYIFEKKDPVIGTLVQVWLKANDQSLAKSYLDLIPGYIEEYSRKLGPFPFESYSVVENSLETGYAFSGFTLLGPSVIRLPFLLRSSLPHEILHSWWGNSVYVDYNRGNWCEGLTSYMADHFYAIQDGKGDEYRRSTLQKFQDFVSKENDFPLRKFISRNDQGTQAVGYGKSLMFFQMLENFIGTEMFFSGLKKFFSNHIWKEVSFTELQSEFESVTNQSLDAFFGPWLDQLGAPQISIQSLEYKNEKLNLSLLQKRPSGEYPYVLPMKIKVIYDDGRFDFIPFIFNQERQNFEFALNQKPKKVVVDPNFEVFRTLYSEETPFAMSQILSPQLEVVISVPADRVEFYQAWVDSLKGFYSKPIRLIKDSEDFPVSGVVWIIGYENKHAQNLETSLTQREVKLDNNQIKFQKNTWSLDNGIVFIGDTLQKRPVVWVWTNQSQWAESMSQRIKHYNTFSFVGFTNQKNDIKLTWSILNSPLIRELK